MAPTISFNSASSKSATDEQDKDGRVFTAEEMHFEGFDFVAADHTRKIVVPQKTRQFQCKHTRDFAPMKCGSGIRKPRFNRLSKDLYTIEEISPATHKDSQPQSEVYVECSR